MLTTPPAPPVPPTTTVPRRLRALVRRCLFAGLDAVPSPLVTAVHDRWITPDGRTHGSWGPLAGVLFHRPLDQTVVTVPGGRVQLSVAGARLERILWWYGEQDPLAWWWRALCTRATSVVEVGAGIGWFSVIGARSVPTGAYTAVEANPEVACVLRQNLRLNGLAAVEVVEAAVVGDGEAREVELTLPDRSCFARESTRPYLYGGPTGSPGRPVRVRTLPSGPLFAGRDLVKLDIGGSEAPVLRAAVPEIRRSRPSLLIRVPGDTTRMSPPLRDLDREDYRMYLVGRRLAPVPLDTVLGPDVRNVLLVPAERAGELPAVMGAVT